MGCNERLGFLPLRAATIRNQLVYPIHYLDGRIVARDSTVSLNIKNAEAHGLAAELARLRGISLTQAVTEALKNELDRERARNRKTGLAEELVEIGKRYA